MNKGTLSVFFGAVILAWMAGCGGTVTSGGDGGGGAGGADGGGGTNSTSSSSSSSATDPQSMCDALCNVGLDAGCFEGPITDCTAGCAQTYEAYPDCKAQIDAAYQCAIDKVPAGGCDVETLCGAEAQAVQACTNGGCMEGTCSGDGTSCSCEAPCNGANLQVDCTESAGGIDCSCLVNGSEVGTCTDDSLSCSLQSGCCSQFF